MTDLENNFIITELKAHDGVTNLVDCNFIEINEDTRLYYKKESYSDFFGFECITIVSNTLLGGLIGIDKLWERDDTEVMYLFKGTALFDGIRHIYFGIEGDENFNGYLYYPDINVMIKALQELKKLEIKYCPQIY